MKLSTLLVIHGVGDSAPGASLLEISQGLDESGVVGERRDIVVGGQSFPAVRLNHPQIGSVIEVNWSDVARPTRNALSVLDHYIRVVLGMLHVASDMTIVPPALATLYRYCIEGALAFCIYPPIVAMLCMTTAPSPMGCAAFGAGGALYVFALTVHLSRYSAAFRTGFIWSLGMLLSAIGAATTGLSHVAYVQMAATVYVASQAAAGALLFAIVLTGTLRRSGTSDRRVAAVALFYFPLFILSAIGAVVWVLALAAAAAMAPTENLSSWHSHYSTALSGLGYDLALVEFTFAGLVALIALGCLMVALAYWRTIRLGAARAGRNAGELARTGVKTVLSAAAVAYLALCVLYVVLAAADWQTQMQLTTAQIYTLSALRVVPYLPLLIGPLAIVAGILVDVVLYATAHPSISTASILQSRFRLAFEYACSLNDAPVVVAAHSQGTVIALDALGQQPARSDRARLITAGSPLASLYERFLGSTPEARAPQGAFAQPRSWLNFSRTGDYIGASQRRLGVQEHDLGPGGHTGYWRVPALWRTVLSALGEEPGADDSRAIAPR